MSTVSKLANQLLTITTALLSSSCCLIQMVLNLFSMSCAGFAVFTPYRSLLTGLTMLLLTTNVVRNGWRQTWKQTTISLLIMVSPEVVQWINIHPHIHGMAHEPIATTSSVVLQLDGLACIACANRIKNALTNIDCVQSASVFFDNSSAVIEYLNGCIPTITKATDTFIDVIKGLDTKYDAWVVQQW